MPSPQQQHQNDVAIDLCASTDTSRKNELSNPSDGQDDDQNANVQLTVV